MRYGCDRYREENRKLVKGMGMSCEINLIGVEPTGKQETLFVKLVRSLEDVPGESIIFEFMNAKNGPDTQQGLVFYQLCRDGRKLHGEVRIDTPEGRRMYARDMEEREALDLLHWTIRTRKAPDIRGWEDITEEIFGEENE